MAESLRIVHAVRSDGFAGVERYAAVLAAAQAAAGHDVGVIGGDPALMAGALQGSGVRWRPGADVAAVVRALNTEPRSDVIQAHMTAAEAATVMAWRSRHVPVVATRHFATPRGSGPLGRIAAPAIRRRVAAQIAISRYVARHIDGDAVVVPSAVANRDYRVARERGRTILVAQRLEAEKGTDVAIEAFAASGLAATGWRLTVAGEGSQTGSLAQLAFRLGVGGSTDFLGRSSIVPELMADASMLLAPCAVEGLGLTALEAMASGLPVVAAASGGHLETVGLAADAALFPANNASVAGDLLRRLALDHMLRDRYGAQLRRVQRETFTTENVEAGTADVYRSIL